MTKDEALKMAIKALAKCKEAYLAGPNWQKVGYDILDKSQQTCKEALEQPSMTYEQGFAHGYEAHKVEQEPLNLNCKSVQKRLAMQWGYVEQPAQNIRESFNEMLEDKVGYYKGKQPAQEPVAWMMERRDDELMGAYLQFQLPTRQQKISHHPTPLYTHPAPSWQGLSITERVNVIKSVYEKFEGCGADILEVEIARAIEQALKEKNHG